jgi:hypothetical protein
LIEACKLLASKLGVKIGRFTEKGPFFEAFARGKCRKAGKAGKRLITFIFRYKIYPDAARGESGGTGRRAGLRIQWGNP